jgi:hypothetical protein
VADAALYDTSSDQRSAATPAVAPAQSPIPRPQTGIAAFVGRTLKGPIHEPLRLASFADFQKHFGGLWQPSTLSYAVEQFFENGGVEAIVVRVSNGGRPPTISLPLGPDGAASLTLTGIAPGSREYLRAAVDHDGIGAEEPDRFNLVVQRLRSPGTPLIDEQEIFRRVSVRPDVGRFVGDVLARSALVRVRGAVPALRPLATPRATAGGAPGYAHANNDGEDGETLTDYDLIGSAQKRTGLFALDAMPGFDLLCVPPLERERDVGASVLLAAARFARERQALLVVDPPREWTTAAEAIAAARHWPFRADNAVMYFPRIEALDRLRGRPETFAGCGAVAGMIARHDRVAPPWRSGEHDDVPLRPGLRPACPVADAERARLLGAGINTLTSVRSAPGHGAPARTLATGNSVATDWRYLAPRRTAQFIATAIEKGTRWMALAHNGAETWQRARAQVEAFLAALDDDGAFAGSAASERYFVICDARLNRPPVQAEGRLDLLFGFAAARAGEFHSFLVTQKPGGSSVRSVTVNRLATPGRRFEESIETALLRGLVGST